MSPSEPAQQLNPLDCLRHLVATLRPGPVQHYRGVHVLPLLSTSADFEAITLGSARAREAVQVAEMSESGRVPVLKVENRATLPLVLLDGESLVGGKQERVMDGSVVIAPGTCVPVPVLCCEQGRWSYRSRGFRSADTSLPTSLKRRKLARSQQALRQRHVDGRLQSMLWSDVAEYSQARQVASPTANLGDVFLADREEIDGYLEAMKPVPDQVGLVSWLHGRLVGAELLGGHELYAESHRRFLHSLAADALASGPWRGGRQEDLGYPAEPLLEIGARVGLSFVADTVAMEPIRHPTAGLGTALHFRSLDRRAAALVCDDRAVHLSAFAR